MTIIKEPHNHIEAPGSVTIIEELSQSWIEGAGSFFAPDFSDQVVPVHPPPRLFGQDILPPDILDLGVLTPTFWTRTFHSDILDLDVSPNILDQKFRPWTVWTWMFHAQEHSELPRPIFQIRPRMYVRRTILYEIAAFCSPEEHA